MTETTHEYLALARGHFGAGATPEEAKQRLRAAGYRRKTDMVVLRLDPPQTIDLHPLHGPMLLEGTTKTVVEDTRIDAKAAERRKRNARRLREAGW